MGPGILRGEQAVAARLFVYDGGGETLVKVSQGPPAGAPRFKRHPPCPAIAERWRGLGKPFLHLLLSLEKRYLAQRRPTGLDVGNNIAAPLLTRPLAARRGRRFTA